MVQVKVKDGVLEGEVINNEYGGQFYSFKGIPYAEPPIGDLRFKAPQPLKPWKGVRSAKEFGPICYQIDFATGGGDPIGSEDCLYLNVYTPDVNPIKPLPVMFYIHGGAFLSGSGNDDMLGPEFLVRHGIILVTINYRLGALGFLCLDTEDIPGNAGMKDQVAALRWVNKNINQFGGDPQNVTIFGESAGGSSVSYHLISTMSKGLFKRAIPQSGVATCWWSSAFEPRERAFTLAKKFGFFSDDDKKLCDYFKSLPLESLVLFNLSNTLSEYYKEYNNVYLTIVNEKQFGDNERFYYGDVYEMLHKKIHENIDLMTGYTEDEGFVGLCRGINIKRIVEQINFINDFLAPKPIALNCPIRIQIEVGKKLRKYYFKNDKVTDQDLDQYVKYLSMEKFIYGIIQFAKFWTGLEKNKIFLYKFCCKTERNFLGSRYLGLQKVIGDRKVVCHADDLGYLFPIKSMGGIVDVGSETFKIIDNVTKLWTNFAKYGNPTPDDSMGVKWMPYSLEKQEYMIISNELVTSTEPDKDEVEFWEGIFREYYPKCLYK